MVLWATDFSMRRVETYIKSGYTDNLARFPSRVFSSRRQFITCRSKVNAPMSCNGRNLYACLHAGKKSISAGHAVENLSPITIPNNGRTQRDTGEAGTWLARDSAPRR